MRHALCHAHEEVPALVAADGVMAINLYVEDVLDQARVQETDQREVHAHVPHGDVQARALPLDRREAGAREVRDGGWSTPAVQVLARGRAPD
eukprot:1978655-Alexandrium_andersonii.AAC.1